MKKFSGFLIALLIGILLLLGYGYLSLPVLSISFVSLWLIIIFFLIIIASTISIVFKSRIILVLPTIAILAFIIYLTSGTSIFRAKDYRAMIGEVKQKDFSTEISPIDITQLPVVDINLAYNLGDKKLGEQVALGSQVELGEFTLINVNDKLTWVAPLVHTGFFKWFSNKSGTPGYITISATNPRDIKLVQELDGKKIFIKYQREAYFNDDLKRHIYMNGYRNIGLTDFSFELDDNGKPYWVVTKYKNTIGFNGKDVLGVIIIDPQTGEIKDYNTKNVPDWVDRVYPTGMAIKQLNDWGRYVNGWWNPSNKGILKTTEGYNYIYNDGKCFIYTGLTSSGADESTVGFTLIDTRTKNATFYKISGSQETAAMASAEGKVQEKGYQATFPILINLDNQPTYFMTLKDKKGLVKLYAMVNVNDYSVVGIGESVTKAKSDYIKTLKNRGDWKGLKDNGDEQKIEGTISRIGTALVEDTTFYYIVLNEKPDKIFITGINMSNELPLTVVGDKVAVEYFDNESSSIDLTKFDNLNIKSKPEE